MFKNIKISKILIEKLSICWRHIEREVSPAKKITLRDRALRVNLDRKVTDFFSSYWTKTVAGQENYSSRQSSTSQYWRDVINFRIILSLDIRPGRVIHSSSRSSTSHASGAVPRSNNFQRVLHTTSPPAPPYYSFSSHCGDYKLYESS